MNTKLIMLDNILAIDARWRAQGVNVLSVGAMGEAIVAALHPSWQRAQPNAPGYDFIDDDGRRVQVKTWGTTSRTQNRIKREADRLIVIQLDGTGGWELICDKLIQPQSWAEADRLRGERRKTLTVTHNMHAIEF